MKDLVPVSEFTSPVQAPEPVVDLRKAITVETGLQQLTNRTQHLHDNKVTGPASSTANALVRFSGTGGKTAKDSPVTCSDAGALEGVASIELTGEVTYETPKTRTFFVPLSQAAPGVLVGSGWDHSSFDAPMTCNADSRPLPIPLTQLPIGAVIDRVRIGCNPGAARAGANRMALETWRVVPNTSTGAFSSSQHGATQYDDTTTNEQVVTLDLTLSPYTIVATEILYLRVISGNTSSSNNDALNWIEIRFADPGPRSPGG